MHFVMVTLLLVDWYFSDKSTVNWHRKNKLSEYFKIGKSLFHG